ncbi:hypothetical protein SAMN04487904_11323 [Actinopolyspora lacussalsi subsp. righensis]|uniref:Uncharacterized protein n=1 Tax=Actinopolyspora righensis TaxID=995060 RepID=A0A1I7BWB3_9ACTN|nr:hypothetical protein [Actinopolyspora righensis]SFT91468.1 hypothetical protein SAMN04487904_11323 [Actinopolyspora righensis]
MSALEGLRVRLAGAADDAYPDQMAVTVEQLDIIAADLVDALRGSGNTDAHTILARINQAGEHARACLRLSARAAGDLRDYADRL